MSKTVDIKSLKFVSSIMTIFFSFFRKYGYIKDNSYREKITINENAKNTYNRRQLTLGIAPPGTDFIIVYMPSGPELEESTT